jgi:hypothetical protein
MYGEWLNQQRAQGINPTGAQQTAAFNTLLSGQVPAGMQPLVAPTPTPVAPPAPPPVSRYVDSRASFTSTPVTNTRPRDLSDAAEFGTSITADPVDTEYTGDNRPEFIRNRTDIDADTYNQFLSELDDITAQANLDYRQEQLRARIDAEATGSVYRDPSDAVSQNLQRQNELFEQQSEALLNKYGIPRTFTTDSGSRYRFNPQGKYTKVFDPSPDFGDYLKAAIKIAVTTVATAGIGSAVAAGLGAAGLPANIANTVADIVVSVARSGGDIKKAVVSAFAAGGGELRSVTDYFPDGLDGMINVARSVYDAANAANDPDKPPVVDVRIDPDSGEPILIDEDGNIIVSVPEPEDERKDKDGGGEAADKDAEAKAKEDAENAEAEEKDKDAEAEQKDKDAEDAEKDKDAEDAEKDKDAEAEKDKDSYDPENPWIYRGNGVFEHVKTGETRTEDVSEYDPYVIGEYYGTGQDPEDFQDSDGDGIPDNEDDDIDGDGYANILDFDPFDPNVWEDPDVVAERLGKETETPNKEPETQNIEENATKEETATKEENADKEEAIKKEPQGEDFYDEPIGGKDGETEIEIANDPSKDGETEVEKLSKDGETEVEKLSKDGETEVEIANDPSKDGETQNEIVNGKDGEAQLAQQALDSKDGEVAENLVGNKDGEAQLSQQELNSKDGETQEEITNNPSKDGEAQLSQQEIASKDGEVETTLPDGTSKDSTGNGDGTGDGDGDGDGNGKGRGRGMLSGGGSKPITPQSFMASISYNPQLLTPFMPQNSKDYLAELLARLQK